jgi:cyanate permease
MLLRAESTALIALGCLLFGLGVGNLVTLPSLIVQHEFPRAAFSTVVSLVVSLNQFTFAFGPAILGALRDWSGDYRASFAFCMTLQALAAVIVVRGRRPTPPVAHAA